MRYKRPGAGNLLRTTTNRDMLSEHMDTNTNPIISKLFSVGAHFGYAPSRRHPSQAPFIFGTKGGVELFDLEQTALQLEAASAKIAALAQERKTVLFVGGKAEARDEVRRAAERVGQPYVASRWIGGTLTNFSEIRKRLARLADLSEKREKGELAKYTKRERLLIDREITDLENMFGGIRSVEKLPDALVIVDSRYESAAVDEANLLGIPVIALINSDGDVNNITAPISANDSSRDTIHFVLEVLTKSYMDHLGPAREPAAV